MTNAEIRPVIPSSESLTNLADKEPYQPYMDIAPPAAAPISDANGTIQTPEQMQAQADAQSTPEPTEFAIKFPSHLPQPPFIHIQGVPNFRDLGGYKCGPSSSSSTSDDNILRPGVLYRCAHPTHLTEAGAEHLTKKLGVTTLYDLRSQPEITRLATSVANDAQKLYPLANPNSGCIDEVPGLTRKFTPVYASDDYGPVALANKMAWYTDQHVTDAKGGYEYSEGFVNAYRDIASHGTGAYQQIFRHLLEKPDEGLVFHCTAGKDRTGVFGALVMKLVGVDEETICWEYALTEPGLGEWRNQFIERISAGGIGGGGGGHNPAAGATSERHTVSREHAARICGSRAGNMRKWLEVVLEGEFGGVEKYLQEKCGFSAEEVLKLKDSLIVKAKDGQTVTPVSIAGWTPNGGVVD